MKSKKSWVLEGNIEYLKKKYQRFKADKTENRNHKQDCVIEYLHYVKVEK